MEVPVIQGYRIRAEIGTGACGVVYEALSDAGEPCAIKVLDRMALNSPLLAEQIRRLVESEARTHTVEIIAQALDARPGCLVMPLFGGDGGGPPRNLQIHLASYLQTEATWPFLEALGKGLAAMHSARVAHGNLKPGNIFLDDEGRPLLSDYASGLMPGVHRIGYSDALLYAPPEQLRSPEGYQDEAGYRWDVYAFGVLAFRLLTGEFPRSNEVFQTVTPQPGQDQRFEIEADVDGIAQQLDQAGEVSWPDEEVDETEMRRREVIASCLHLDPLQRPFNMREVVRRFEAITSDLVKEQEIRELVALREKAERKRQGANRRFSLTSLVALGLAAGWGVTWMLRRDEAAEASGKFEQFQNQSETTIVDLASQRDEARTAEAIAFNERDEIQKALDSEQSKAMAELQSAQRTNESLFNWILEVGVEGLPTLEGRRARLGELKKEVDMQLEGMSDRPALADQAARLRLRRAELAIARGELAEGERDLARAIEEGGLPDQILARAHLRLLLLVSKREAIKLTPRLEKSEPLILAAFANDEVRLIRAKAALDLAKARMHEAGGDGAQALASYLQSLNGYRELEKLYPTNLTLGLMVGRRYLSAAMAAEGEGEFENAAKLREEAAGAFTVLAEKQEKPAPEIQYQIASAKAAQAISLWQQGDTFGAEKLAREGMSQLAVLIEKLPGDFRVTMDLASQRGIVATALRDEGKSSEARNLLKEGVSALAKGIESEPENWGARYLCASLKWQLSSLLGQQGEGDAELEMGREARDELKALLQSKMKRPNPSEVRKSLAYLCGDLGHSADLKNQREVAIQYLEECKIYWQELARDEGDQLEIREGYHWAVNRLAEMGVK